MPSTANPKRIMFIMSDTGGGHRAAARAIEAALQMRHPGEFTTELVDGWRNYTPWPGPLMPELYAPWINYAAPTYAAQFWFHDHAMRNPMWSWLYCELGYGRMKRMLDEHPADIIVCVHSVFNRAGIHALRKANLKTPFITVITDYAWPVVLWYDPRVDTCLVPTDPAFERGLKLGMPPDKMVMTGAVVHPRFADAHVTKAEARAQLGWDPDAQIVLMVGGGDGMGPLVATAKALDALPVDLQLVVVAGRNQQMKANLEAVQWRRPVRIYGFVTEMPVFMKAADLLITKAGPATITEAALMGLPMVLSGAIKFQESPNVDYVVQKGAGLYAPGPRRVADCVGRVLNGQGPSLDKLAEGVRKIAQPDAVWKIADKIWEYR